ncbi:MAG: carboxy terminal-processing peptidase [Syntrophotaleaceae bacterium]
MIRYFTTSVILLLVFILGSSSAQVSRNFLDFQTKREHLLAYLVRQQLAANHFSHKEFDDSLSRAAFTLYVKQLDSQKRFLLAEDVRALEKYARLIDDEMISGYIEFPRASKKLLERRVGEVQKMFLEIMDKGFDFSQQEDLETDPEKLVYCRNQDELYERWRKILKYQVLWRYLDLQEAAQKKPMPEKRTVESTKALPAGQIDKQLLEEATEKIRVSTRQLFDRLLTVGEQDYLDRYFDAVCRAFDPHTNYLPPEENEDFQISMKGSLEGIGATLREEDGFIKVVSIVPGSPAFREGQLHAEDIILKVAEGDAEPVDVTDARLRDAVRLIRGKKGTSVKLTVRRPEGTELVIAIIRDVVQIEETFVKATVMEPVDGQKGRFGYLKIPTFYRDFSEEGQEDGVRNSTDDTRKALQELARQKIDGIVVDLRNNGGGSLVDAVQIAGLFIPQGPIVQVKNSNGELDILRDKDSAVYYDGPVVVLVNRFSASASEILAGALQDYRRAVVLGSERTHGKGTVQTIINLNRALTGGELERYKPLGAMKITIQKFYRISGQSTQMEGVVPDIVLPDPLGYLKSGERYAEYALAWDSVSRAEYKPWSLHPEVVESLRAHSRKRLSADPRYLRIAEQASHNENRSQKSRYPLVPDGLRRELDELKALREEAAVEPEDSEGKAADPASWKKDLVDDFTVTEAVRILGDLLDFEKELIQPRQEVAGTVSPS